MFTNFASCVPLRYFRLSTDIITTTGTSVPFADLWRRITSYGCSAWWFRLYAFRTFWYNRKRLYLFSILNQYRFSSSTSLIRPTELRSQLCSCLLQRRRKMEGDILRLSVSPGGFIPDAANTSGPDWKLGCIVSFCIGNNYRDLAAASLCVRLLQTHLLYRSPPCTLEQRSIQPVWWWRVLCFSHRETCSHHKGSLPGHTHGVWRYWGWTL